MTRTLKIRVSDAEGAALDRAAIAVGVPLAEFIRRCVFPAAGLPRKTAHKPRGRPYSSREIIQPPV